MYRRACGLMVAAVAAAVGVVALPGTAQAAYDPTPLCPSPTLTAQQVSAALATVRANSEAWAVNNGGFALSLDEQAPGLPKWDPTRDGIFGHDLKGHRTRYDEQVTEGKRVRRTHLITDQGSATRYAGHTGEDGVSTRSGLRVLGGDWAWVPTPVAPSEVTDAALTAQGWHYSWVSELDALAQQPAPGTQFGCSVHSASGMGILWITVARPGLDPLRVRLFFLGKGQLEELSVETGAGYTQMRAEGFGYPTVSAAVPAANPVVSDLSWRRAVVRGTFQDLKKASLSSAKAAVKKEKSHAKRVSALRKVLKAKAAKYQAQGQAATYTTVKDGARVKALKPGSTSSTWSFTFTVSGTKVKVVDHT